MSNLDCQTGSRVLDQRQTPALSRRVVKGIVLLEGSFPVDHLNPALKHVIHYGPQTGDAGVLDWVSMFVFERNNKRVKGMVKHTVQTLSSLANHVEADILSRHKIFSKKEKTDYLNQYLKTRLTVPTTGYVLSEREQNAMEILGVTSFQQVKSFKVAHVLGVHFRCGEWGCRRCGSVITTIYRRVSRYAIVNMFLEVEGQGYASVTWLSPPSYPCNPFKLVVKVRLMTAAEQRTHQSVISVDMIEPCQVAVLPDSDGTHFYMLRDKGTDRDGSGIGMDI